MKRMNEGGQSLGLTHFLTKLSQQHPFRLQSVQVSGAKFINEY